MINFQRFNLYLFCVITKNESIKLLAKKKGYQMASLKNYLFLILQLCNYLI